MFPGFHIPCIDNWLVRSSFCPVCKRNAIDQEDELNSSESTSLLSAFAWQTGSSITPLNSLIGTSTIDRAARAPGMQCVYIVNIANFIPWMSLYLMVYLFREYLLTENLPNAGLHLYCWAARLLLILTNIIKEMLLFIVVK